MREEDEKDLCLSCGFYDPDFGCGCASFELWYACPMEKPTLEDFETVGEAENKGEENEQTESV